MRKITIREYAQKVASDVYNRPRKDIFFCLEDDAFYYGIKTMKAFDNHFVVIGEWGMGDTLAYDITDCVEKDMAFADWLSEILCDYLERKCGYNNCNGDVEIWV